MLNNTLLSLVTDLLFAQSFHQESSYMWIPVETSVKVSATLTLLGIAAPGDATGKKSWILLEHTATAVNSEGGIF